MITMTEEILDKLSAGSIIVAEGDTRVAIKMNNGMWRVSEVRSPVKTKDLELFSAADEAWKLVRDGR